MVANGGTVQREQLGKVTAVPHLSPSNPLPARSSASFGQLHPRDRSRCTPITQRVGRALGR